MIHSFLLIGQSNMAGRGFLHEAVEVDNSHIKTLRNGRWVKMFRPINPDRSFSGVSLGERFAERYAQKYGVDVGLICCADGGTQIEQWQAGGILLDNAIYQAKLASRTSTIAGVLWHQGESDCSDELLRATYEQSFLAIMKELRDTLDLHDVPFLIGGLGDYLVDYAGVDCSGYRDINDTLERIAQNNPMTGFVKSEGLTPNSDNLHFSAQSLYELGNRYFEVYEQIRDLKKVFLEKDTKNAAIQSGMELM
ncbi:MAG: sialate O-acetylesterase [Lachnospiraceae bacterium]|nr:sialate O-acetylesterase [Lachnospiraceae bacterium]